MNQLSKKQKVKECARPKGKMRKVLSDSNNIYLYIMMLIPMLFLIAFNYLPMFGIIIGFKDYRFDKGIFGSEWVGFKNIEFFLKSNDFLQITRNTILLNILFIVVGMIAAILLAILLSEITGRNRTKLLQTVYIMPNFMSWVVVASMVYTFLSPTSGMINKILEKIGQDPVSWYAEPKYWPWILCIVSVWKHIGMDSVIYYASLMGVDTSIIEAAKIDGANRLDIVKNIYIPMLVPLISILFIMKVGGIFRADFGLFYQITRDSGELYSVTDVLDTYVYRLMTVSGNMSVSTAIGFLQSVVGTVMVLITNFISGKLDPDNRLF